MAEVNDKWLYSSIVMLGMYFIFRLINQARMIFSFPLDFTNDIGSHMAQLHFLYKYGFMSTVPNWYNGYVLFKSYAPGWFLSALPLYSLTQKIELTAYLSLISLFLMAFLVIYLFGAKFKLSIAKRVAFFLFLFANPIAIGNFIRLGRVTELFGWVFFIIIAFLSIYYAYKRLDAWFYLIFTLSYAMLLISHLGVALIAHVVLLSLLIVRNNMDRLKIMASMLVSAVLSSFWLYQFIIGLGESNITSLSFSNRLLDFTGPWLLTNIASLLIPLLMFALFLLYLRNHRNELLFYMPVIITAILFVSRLVIFMPLINNIMPDIYMTFFMFFIIYFLMKLSPGKISAAFIKYTVPIIVILWISLSLYHTPMFKEHSALDNDIISLLPGINGPFLMLNSPTKDSSSVFYYAYTAIYYNAYTPWGAGAASDFTQESKEKVRLISKDVEGMKCEQLRQDALDINLRNILAFDDYCSILRTCNLNELGSRNNVCLYSF